MRKVFEEDPIDLAPDISGAELASLALRRLHVKTVSPQDLDSGEKL
jgi:hypothetical protein